jgi:hypothetical protein
MTLDVARPGTKSGRTVADSAQHRRHGVAGIVGPRNDDVRRQKGGDDSGEDLCLDDEGGEIARTNAMPAPS